MPNHLTDSLVAAIAVIVTLVTACSSGDGSNSWGGTNRAPVASDSNESTYPGDTVSSTMQASDPDGDSLEFSIVTQGAKGTTIIGDINTGTYSYYPSAGAIGTDSFTFKANDGTVDSNIATVTITDIAPATPSSGLGASAGDQRVTVSWDPVAGAASYTVYWSDTPGTGTGGNVISGITSPPFYHDGRSNGTTYYYVMTAVNVAGESGASTEVSATPADIALSSLSYSDGALASCVSSEASGLTYVHQLTSLYCGSAGISDITGLEALTSLTSLNLGANSITSIVPIQGLTQLTELYLSGNSITNIASIQRLTGLTRLTLNNNSISDISALAGLTLLDTLHIYYNSISDISALSGMSAMTELKAYHNNISNLVPLAGLTSMFTLMLEENSIVDVNALRNLTALDTLALSNNNIVDVSPLANITGINILKLLTNNIGGEDIGNIDNLSTLTSASAIYLGSNVGMSCNELTSLIAVLGEPPVNVHPTGATPSPGVIPGTTCTAP